MDKNVVQLYPQPGGTVPLQGLYLNHQGLTQLNNTKPTVYANFLTSLDGRIALKADDEHLALPAALKSDEDFMLLLELYAHADCIITHGGYMRSLQAGRLGNVLQLPSIPTTEYIHNWRKQRGMKPNPDIMIVSGSLDFPWHRSLNKSQQQVYISTGGKASAENHQYWQERGHQVQAFGNNEFVDVDQLMKFLETKGYRSIYLMAGPELLQDMLKHGCVKYFFMTISHQLLSGTTYKTLLDGEPLAEMGRLSLQSLYMDVSNSNKLGQWYVEFTI